MQRGGNAKTCDGLHQVNLRSSLRRGPPAIQMAFLFQPHISACEFHSNVLVWDHYGHLRKKSHQGLEKPDLVMQSMHGHDEFACRSRNQTVVKEKRQETGKRGLRLTCINKLLTSSGLDPDCLNCCVCSKSGNTDETLDPGTTMFD